MQGILNRMKSHVKVCQPQVHTAEPEPQPSTRSYSVQPQSNLTVPRQNTGLAFHISLLIGIHNDLMTSVYLSKAKCKNVDNMRMKGQFSSRQDAPR